MRADIVRADRNSHISIPKSIVKFFEDVWALIAHYDFGIVLCQGRLDLRQLSPFSVLVLVDKELSIDMEGLLSVYVKVAHRTWSISAVTIINMHSARALIDLRAPA